MHSSSLLQMAGTVFKHYQVPQKEKKNKVDINDNSASINLVNDNTSHKRWKSYNSNWFMRQSKIACPQESAQLVISKVGWNRKDNNKV